MFDVLENSMPILAFTHVKGGVGKSTSAVMLSYWLTSKMLKKTITIDADTQRSSSTWLKSLGLSYKIEQDPDVLTNLASDLSEHHDYVLIDCAGGLTDLTRVALLICDLALIPVQPSGLDIHSLEGLMLTLKAARRIRKGFPVAGIFLSLAKKGRVLLKEAEVAIAQYPCHKFSQVIYDRECIRDAFLQRQTVWQQSGKSAQEAGADYDRLFANALEVVNVQKK